MYKSERFGVSTRGIWLGIWLSALGLMFTGCGDDDPNPGGGSLICNPGDPGACQCENGAPGSQTCSAEGTPGQCICESDPTGGMGGFGNPIAGTGGMGGVGGVGGSVEAGTGGSTAGSGGSVSGDFPKDEAVNVEMVGPYEVASYEGAELSDPTYLDPKVWYPANGTPPYAAVAIAPGLLGTTAAMDWWGPVLASNGIVTIIATATETTNLFHGPPARSEDLIAQLAKLTVENARAGSPLQGLLDTSRFAVMGHSMGGGASLIAANGTLQGEVRAVVSLQGWSPSAAFPNITAPTLFLGAQGDGIAPVASNTVPHFNSIVVTKVLAIMAQQAQLTGSNPHMVGTNTGPAPGHALQGRYALAWFKRYLEDDQRYEPYLYGAEHDSMASSFSQYEVGN